MNLIEVKNVYKQYKNGVTALSDITLSIPKGDFVFVIGSTASGKSTLIKLLYRQEKPSRGEVYVGGINVSKLRNRKVYKLRRKLGIVFQDYKLLQNLTVFENVAFALEIYGLPENEVRKKVMNAIEPRPNNINGNNGNNKQNQRRRYNCNNGNTRQRHSKLLQKKSYQTRKRNTSRRYS